MKDCIGIDIGYGFTKTYSAGKSHSFPTMVHLTTHEKQFTEMQPISANGRVYLVGKEAEREGSHVDTRTKGFIASDPWMAILGHALRLHSYDGRADLVLGIPPSMHSADYVDEIIAAIRNAAICPNGTGRAYSFGTIHVIPQGVGIFLRHVDDCPDDFYRTVVVIDVGYRTLDMTLFSEKKYVVGTSESARCGISYLLDDIIKAFDRKHHEVLHYSEALQMLKDGQVTRLGKTYWLEEDAAVKGYIEKVVSFINRCVDTLPIAPDLAIVGGGGIHVLAQRLEGLKHELIIVPTPEMANAHGYWCYGIQAE